MFSLPKLIVLALIIAGVWYGFRWVQRVQDRRAREDKVMRNKKSGPGKDTPKAVEDMVKCPACGTFVAALEGGSCGGRECPATK